ncbi:MAG TPA: 16S rRNA (cytosine(1402)-N(4))-methyltransferase RsmH [Verrucomicrobiae bacterium]|nr:16S rRNA (cytosine(1402)-N(4))-methyltransferase RsmH [Verrucomicrobiae bacterium]
MLVSLNAPPSPDSSGQPHRRRPRYAGKHPRRFAEKYKEHDPQRFVETVEKVIASGKTPAGTHRPIMVAEVLEALAPRPGELVADCTLGYGGHARELLARILPGGHLCGLDADPVELPKAEARLRALGFGEDVFTAHRSNFAGLPQVLAEYLSRSASAGDTPIAPAADVILADLGVSSMQLDDPTRGFSVKFAGPLDMRMNPGRGQSAARLLQNLSPGELAEILQENADEPRATELAAALAGKDFATTTELAEAIRVLFPKLAKEEVGLTTRRVFQALRIAVNDEFNALDNFLRVLPQCLKPGGRVAILTFHSGEDRRVKKSFEAGLRAGAYAAISHDVIRPGHEERNSNPRSAPAKLRWARRAS